MGVDMEVGEFHGSIIQSASRARNKKHLTGVCGFGTNTIVVFSEINDTEKGGNRDEL